MQQVAFAPTAERIDNALWASGSVIRLGRGRPRNALQPPSSTGSKMGTGVVAVTAAWASLAAPTVDGDVDLLDSRTLTPTGRIRLAQMPAPTDRPAGPQRSPTTE